MAKLPEHQKINFEAWFAGQLQPCAEIRRNPQSRRRWRVAGPPPEATDAELAALRSEALEIFIRKRGCPREVYDGQIDYLRRTGRWHAPG